MTGRDLRRAYEGTPAVDRSRWAGLPPQLVRTADLHPTQWPHYDPCRLCMLRLGRPVEGGDPYPHLVEWQGRRYVWDGGHRVALALRTGRATILARVLRV